MVSRYFITHGPKWLPRAVLTLGFLELLIQCLGDEHEILEHHKTNNCVVTLNGFVDPFASVVQDVTLKKVMQWWDESSEIMQTWVIKATQCSALTHCMNLNYKVCPFSKG
jgi:hypothetical protein